MPRSLRILIVLALAVVPIAAQRGGASGPAVFTHRSHVQQAWFEGNQPEVERDCRGCHGFGREGVRDPQQVCASCHYEAFRLDPAPGYEETLAELRSAVAVVGFEHVEHGSLACRTCHLKANLEGKLQRGSRPSEDLPIPSGFNLCARCHGAESRFEEMRAVAPGNVLFGRVPAEGWEQGFFARLDAEPGMGPERVGPFEHGQHVLDVARVEPLATFFDAPRTSAPHPAADSTCSTCHVPTTRALATELFEKEWDDASCGDCHLSRKGPIRFERLPAEVPSLTALTFAHRDHLELGAWKTARDQASSQAYDDIERRSCFACHAPEAQGVDFGLSRRDWSYAGCVTCHDAGPWVGASRTTDPERGWSHGEWGSCTRCHDYTGSDMRTDRPAVTVDRRRPKAFRIRTQMHPDISAPLDDDCRTCHKAEAGALPSRVAEKAFRHATHLPPPTADNRADLVQRCQTCHGSRVGLSESSQELGARLRGEPLGTGAELFGLTYDPAACSQCHLGSPPEVVAWTPLTKEVVAFPHRPHLTPKAGSAPLDCVSCHVGDTSTPAFLGGDLGVLPAAQRCQPCHVHDDGAGARITGPVTKKELAACRTCHLQRIPARAEAFERPHLAGLAISGFQVHPPERTCSECHLVDPELASEREQGKVNHIAATHDSPHGQGRPENCLGCHWNGAKDSMGENPEDPAVRKRLGALLGDYPGPGAGR